MNFLDNALPCRDEDPELFFRVAVVLAENRADTAE